MDHGRVIADDTPQRLKADHAGDRISLGFADPGDARAASGRVWADATASVTGSTLEIRVPSGPVRLPGLLRDLDDAGTPALSVRVVEPTLDDVFLALIGRSLREGRSSDSREEPTDRPDGSGTSRDPRADTQGSVRTDADRAPDQEVFA